MPLGLAILLFLGKPFWYSLILTVARKNFAEFGPHWPPLRAGNTSPEAMKAREKLTFTIGGLVRAALGWTFLLTGYFLGDFGNKSKTNFSLCLGAYGFILWCLVGKAVFRRAPLGHVLVFAAVAEIMSLFVDISAMAAGSSIRVC